MPWKIIGEPDYTVNEWWVKPKKPPKEFIRKRFVITQKEKRERREQDDKDRKTPISGHELKILRAKLGVTQAKFAKIIGCSNVMVASAEVGKKNFDGQFRLRIHQIRRYTDMALNDMRDRFEMPDFSK